MSDTETSATIDSAHTEALVWAARDTLQSMGARDDDVARAHRCWARLILAAESGRWRAAMGDKRMLSASLERLKAAGIDGVEFAPGEIVDALVAERAYAEAVHELLESVQQSGHILRRIALRVANHLTHSREPIDAAEAAAILRRAAHAAGPVIDE